MIRRILIIVLSILMLLAAFIAWLGLTESGLSFAISQTQKFVPALTIQKTAGRFYDGAEFEHINYQIDENSSVSISNLVISWQTMRLFSGQLVIDKLLIGDVVLTQNGEKATETSPIELPNINIPIGISLKNLSLNSLALVDKDQNKTTVISGFKTEISAWSDALKIQALSINYADNVSLELNGQITLSDNYKTDLTYQWTVLDPKLKTINAQGTIQGDLTELKIEQQLLKPVQSTQNVTASDLLGKLTWTADIHLPQLALADFVEGQTGVVNDLIVNANGDLTSADILVDSQFEQAGLPTFNLHSQTSTDDFDNWFTDTNVSTKEGAKLSIKGDINNVSTTPTLALTGQWQQLAWPLLEAKKTVTSNQGNFSINGDLEHYEVALKGELSADQQAFIVQAAAHGTANQIDLEQLLITGMGGNMKLAGWFNWQSVPRFEITTNWQDIIVPEALSALMIRSKKGDINIAGTTETFMLTSDIALALDDKPATILIKGTGSDKGFKQLNFNAKTGSGELGFNGEAYWLDSIKVNGKVNLHNVNPALFAPDWQGDLSGGWTMSVDNVHDQMADIRIVDLDVKGSLRERQLTLQGALSYIKSELDIPNLELVSGKSTISVDGQLKKDLAFNLQLNSPDLADFYPDLGGQLKANATITGKLAAPIIEATLSGQKIAYGDTLTIANANTDFSLNANSKVNGKIVLTGIKANTLPALNAQLNIEGNQAQHQLSFDVTGDQLKASGNIAGQLVNKNWQGQLTKLEFEQTKAGQWQLTKQGPIDLAADKGQIDEQCLQSDQGNICFQGNYSSAGGWQAATHFNNVSMKLFHAFSAALEPVEGQLQGQLELSSSNQYPTEGQGEISLVNASIAVDAVGQKDKRIINFKTVKLDYLLNDEKTTVNLLVAPDLKGMSPLVANAELPILETVINDPDNAALSGMIKTNVDDLSIFDDFNSEYDNLKGQLNVNMSLSGTVKNPALVGKIALDKVSVELPSAGLMLTDMKVNAKGSLDKGIEFNYQAISGKGNLIGGGQFIVKNDTWQMDANLKASNAEVVNLPEAYVVATTDLTISVNPESSQVKGSVTIPEAELAPLQFNSPVTPSKDVIIITNETPDEEKPFPTLLDINVALGDKVNISAAGFNSRLTGKLLVTGDTSKIILGTGAIVIKDGKYNAYGQKLTVDNGQILFSGGAIDNPQLDVKAIRTGENFVAGLHVQGAANNPQITLFSEPAMSQDNVLSYIVLGRPLGEASATDAALLASAATGLGIDGGNQIGERIASTFGLDNVSIAGSGGDDTALQVGKYLSPKLYLGYGIGIFEPVSTVIMRYTLSKIWSLKAESGTESSVDLLYTHER